MQLILAIDPDRRQAEQLASIVRSHLPVELVQAASAGVALQRLADRVPDLVMTSPLLSPFDDAVIDEYLRELGPAAAHVQTLRIPVMTQAPNKRRLLSLPFLRAKAPVAPEGCDPQVFVDEISEYLARAAQEKKRAAAEDRANAPSAPPPPGNSPDAGASVEDEETPGGWSFAPEPVEAAIGPQGWSSATPVDDAFEFQPEPPRPAITSILLPDDSFDAEPISLAAEAAPLTAGAPGQGWLTREPVEAVLEPTGPAVILGPVDDPVEDEPAPPSTGIPLFLPPPPDVQPRPEAGVASADSVTTSSTAPPTRSGTPDSNLASAEHATVDHEGDTGRSVPLDPVVEAAAPLPADPPATRPEAAAEHTRGDSFKAALAAIKAAWGKPNAAAPQPSDEAARATVPSLAPEALPSSDEIDLTASIEHADQAAVEPLGEPDVPSADFDDVGGQAAAGTDSVPVYHLAVGPDLREIEAQLMRPPEPARQKPAPPPTAPALPHDVDTVENAAREATPPDHGWKRSKRPSKPRRGTRPAAESQPGHVQDEWGIFDPSQCGFAALVEKLDKISSDGENEGPPPNTTVRIISAK